MVFYVLSCCFVIDKSGIDNFAIELLEKRGYQYIYAPSIAPDLSACDAQAGSNTPTRKIQ